MTQRRFWAMGAVMALVVLMGGVGPTQAGAAVVSKYPMRTWQVRGTVNAVAYSGSTVYVGGRFDRVVSPSGSKSRARRNLAAFNLKTGAPRRWSPKANAEVRALAVSPNGATVYVGGDFKAVRGVRRLHAASVSAKTGRLRHFSPNISATVKAIAISSNGSSLYLGGPFKKADGHRRLHLASYRLDTGALRSWAPNPHGSNTRSGGSLTAATVAAITLSPTNNTLYVGGVFTRIHGKSRTNGAAISTSKQGTARAFRPKLSHSVTTVDLTSSGKRAFYGGRGPGGFLAAFGSKQGTNLWRRHFDGDVQAATVHGKRLYVGGHFDRVKGRSGGSAVARRHLAAFSLKTGALGGWNPLANSSHGVFGMDSTRGHVAAGGSFTEINRDPQAGFAQFTN